jgi:magnesium transporter
MTIRILLSRADGSDTELDPRELAGARLSRDELLWIDATSPDSEELATICRVLDLGTETAAALDSFPDHPSARVYDDAVEVVVLGLAEDLEAEPVPVRILVGREWVVTHHPTDVAFLAEHRTRIQDGREVGRLQSIEYLASILDRHVDIFFRAAHALDREVDDLDDAALRARPGLLARLVAMRRRIAHVRSVLVPHRELVAEVSRPDFVPKGAAAAPEAIGALAQRLERAVEAVANAREMLIGTFDVHMTQTAQRTNDIMRILTLASVILLPSVVIAGVMGMNFKVGFFEQPNLFWLVIGVMVALAVGTLGVARWRGWV